jgi:hypothetical protein
MEGISGGFVYGAGGSGFIASHYGETPTMSAVNSPRRTVPTDDHAPHGLSAAFQGTRSNDCSVQTGVM